MLSIIGPISYRRYGRRQLPLCSHLCTKYNNDTTTVQIPSTSGSQTSASTILSILSVLLFVFIARVIGVSVARENSHMVHDSVLQQHLSRHSLSGILLERYSAKPQPFLRHYLQQ